MVCEAHRYRGVIGLTGSIGSGKTTAAEHFRTLGAFVISADALVREATALGAPCLKDIRERFGDEVFFPEGHLNRKALGALVFNDPVSRKTLEGIIHPRVAELATVRFRAAPPGALIVYDCPLLFEAGLAEQGFDLVIVVTAPTAAIIRRIGERDGLTVTEAAARLASQAPQEEKIASADIVIENSGTILELQARVEEVYRGIIPHQ